MTGRAFQVREMKLRMGKPCMLLLVFSMTSRAYRNALGIIQFAICPYLMRVMAIRAMCGGALCVLRILIDVINILVTGKTIRFFQFVGVWQIFRVGMTIYAHEVAMLCLAKFFVAIAAFLGGQAMHGDEKK